MLQVFQQPPAPVCELLSHLPCVFITKAPAANPSCADALQLLIRQCSYLCRCALIQVWSSPPHMLIVMYHAA